MVRLGKPRSGSADSDRTNASARTNVADNTTTSTAGDDKTEKPKDVNAVSGRAVDGIAGARASLSAKCARRALSRRFSEDDATPLLAAEQLVRKKAQRNPAWRFFVDGYSAFKVFGIYLISLESIFGCLLSIGATIYAYYQTQDKPGWDGAMDWVLLSFAVITPMSVSIGMAFRRRERALKDLTVLRSCAYQIYLAHACWDWGKGDPGGRAKSSIKSDGGEDQERWLRHSDEALAQLVHIGDELFRFLTLPTASRARHRVTRAGRAEAAGTIDVAHRLFDSLLTHRMSRVTSLTEVLKKAGMPGNEASRVRQWERFLGEAVEDLRMIKLYRTPQALRSFARLFTVFLPPFYSPTYAQLARDTNSLGMGIAFACITSLALTALFESIRVLEDPFVAHLTLDGIDVHEELTVLHYYQLVNARGVFYPNATEFAMEQDLIVQEGEKISQVSRTSSYAQIAGAVQ